MPRPDSRRQGRREAGRRRGVGLLLALVAVPSTLLLIAAPPLIGRHTLSRLEAALVRTADVGGGELRVGARERGWFSSVLDARLSIAGYRPQALSVRIAHGPVRLGLIRAGRSPFVAANVQFHLAGAERPVADAVLHFGGDWDARAWPLDVQLQSANGRPGGAGHARVSRLQAAFEFRARARALAVRAVAADGELGEGAVRLHWRDLALIGEYTLDRDGWPFGATSVRAAHLYWPALEWRLSGTDLSAATTDHGDYVALRLSLRGEGGEIGGQRLGPSLLDAAARRVSRPALGAWVAGDSPAGALFAGADLSVTELQVRDETDSVLLSAAATAGYAAADLADLELSLDLSVSEPFARSVFRQAAERMLGDAQVFGKLSELDDEEQRAIARASAGQQLSVLTAQRYLRLSRGVYSTRVTLRDGDWALNGRRIAVR